jgi:hypothetical protein
LIQVNPGSERVTTVIVKSQIFTTGAQLDQAMVEVLDDLRIIRLKKVGDKKWSHARTGADWDDSDEQLTLDFVKLMGWAIESEDYEVWTLNPQTRFEKLREVRDALGLYMEVRHCKRVTTKPGRLEIWQLMLGIFPREG